MDFNLSDSDSKFLIYNRIVKVGDFVVVELFIEPLIG